jgi:hypothetical protein
MANALKKLNHELFLPRFLMQCLFAAMLAELLQFKSLSAILTCGD